MKRNNSQRASQTPVTGARVMISATIVVSKQERVPLEVHERLPGVEQREVKRIDANEAQTREEVQHQHQREARPGPAHGANGEIAVVEPEHHRRQEETLRAETEAKRVDEFGERQDAVAADQSLRLHGEGYEGGKGDEPEQAKEQERDELVARRLVAPAPQRETHAVEGRAAPGDEGVSLFRDGRETRQMSIESEPEPFAGRLRQRQETRFGAARAPAIGRDILHRALELGFANLRILLEDLLIGPVFDTLARQLSPIARPVAAEPAIAVIEEPRPRAQGSRFEGIRGLILGRLLHGSTRLAPAHFVRALLGETVGDAPLARSLRRGALQPRSTRSAISADATGEIRFERFRSALSGESARYFSSSASVGTRPFGVR